MVTSIPFTVDKHRPSCQWCRNIYRLCFGEFIRMRSNNWGQSLSQTDRRTNFLTPYTGVCGFFLSVKFATSLTRFARRGISLLQCINIQKIKVILLSLPLPLSHSLSLSELFARFLARMQYSRTFQYFNQHKTFCFLKVNKFG